LISSKSFILTIKSFVIRGEATYYDGKYFQTEDPAANNSMIYTKLKYSF